MKRPYYVEHPNEWITHETWSADGESMAFMHIPVSYTHLDVYKRQELDDPDAGLVIEVKYASSMEGLEAASARALAQIRAKRYDERLRSEGRENILAYGIAFCKKRCKVACEHLG